MVLYATLAVCAVGAALLVWRYDLYEREPWPMLVVVALAGAATMWLAGRLEEWTLGALTDGTFVDIAPVAATREEILRVVVILLLAMLVPGAAFAMLWHFLWDWVAFTGADGAPVVRLAVHAPPNRSSHSSRDRGQSSFSNRENARSASTLPPV